MRKTIQTVCAAVATLAMLVLTGCDNTAALKTAVEEANKACPTALGTLGQATSLSLEENALVCELAPAAQASNSPADINIMAKYAALELQRSLPDLMKMAAENGMSLKCNLKAEGSEPAVIEVTNEELQGLSAKFTAAGGQVAPILLPLYEQEMNNNAPLEIAEGLTLKNVKLNDGKATFFINVDDDKAKFDDVRGKIVKSLENAEEKVKLAGINLDVLLPLLQELNYEAIFRYSAKGGKETYMEIKAQEIKDLLTKDTAAEEEKTE